MNSLIVVLVFTVFLYSSGEAANCNDGSNPCGLDGGYYSSANGYQCSQSGPNSVVCTCPGGYEIDRRCDVCSRSNPLQNPCRNDTGRLITCLENNSLGTGYLCLCLNPITQMPEPTVHPNCGEPFTPPTNTSTNTTAQSSCANGGVSIGTTCKCPSGFIGTSCNQSQPEELCRNVICKNNGACAIRNPNGPYESVCLCRASFSGEYCEIQGTLGFCSSTSCFNGAACREVVIGATRTAYCDCLLGYRGVKCDNRYFSCPVAGKFRDDEMYEQGKYFECSNLAGGLRLERKSCAKGLRFNTGTQACTD
ncbi:unnamed protein product [Rotaria sordida]|uniref:EGF-like domain-containing protein n=2 Tax=Rotaria sordida TaxID=392033 RepID=A0A815FHW1_9BILA|nr:unnamed protein product [Rotaria sordida]